MPVDALLQRLPFENVFKVPRRLVVALALDRHRPRLGLEAFGIHRRIVLVGAELVVIVVRRDFFPLVRLVCFFVDAELALLDVLELTAVGRRLGRTDDRLGAHDPRGRCHCGATRRLNELAPVQIDLFVGNFRARNVDWAFDQHTQHYRGLC